MMQRQINAAHRERGHRSEASGWIEGQTDLLVYSSVVDVQSYSQSISYFLFSILMATP
jgi:hypothetical protein